MTFPTPVRLFLAATLLAAGLPLATAQPIKLGELNSYKTFPAFLAEGALVRGVVDDSYWLDLGTPWDFVRGSADLVRGIAPWSGHSPAEALVLDGGEVDPSAVVGGGTTVGRGAQVAAQARVQGSVLLDGAVIDEGAVVEDSVIGVGAATRRPRSLPRRTGSRASSTSAARSSSTWRGRSATRCRPRTAA